MSLENWHCSKRGWINEVKARMLAHVSLPCGWPYWERWRLADEFNWATIPSSLHSVTVSIASTARRADSNGRAPSKPTFQPLQQECKSHIHEKHTSLFWCGLLSLLLTERASRALLRFMRMHIHDQIHKHVQKGRQRSAEEMQWACVTLHFVSWVCYCAHKHPCPIASSPLTC